MNDFIGYPRLDLSTAFSRRTPMPEQILPGLIRGIVGGLVAPGATGKSMVALQLAVYRAGGVDFFGFGACKPGRVIVFCAEDPEPILEARLFDIGAQLSAEQRETVKEHLQVVPVNSRMPRDLFDGGATADAIIREAEGLDLAIIDTVSRFQSGDEGKREDAAKVMRQMERIAEVGPAVVFLGHTTKAAALNGHGDLQQAARGSSVWVDESRWVAFLATCSLEEARRYGIDEEFRKNFVRYGVSKANYAASRPDIWLRRDTGGVLVPEVMHNIKRPTGKSGRIEKLAETLGAEICDDPETL